MTEDKFHSEYVEGYALKKWLFFGAEEWHEPFHRLHIIAGRKSYTREISVPEMQSLLDQSNSSPTELCGFDGYRWWLYKGRCFRHQGKEADPEVIKGLIIQKDARAQAQREKAIRVARNEGL